MGRYYDIDRLAEMCRAKADTLIEGKEAFLYVAKWLDLLPVDGAPVRAIAKEIFADIDVALDASLANTPLHLPFNYIDIQFMNRYDNIKKSYEKDGIGIQQRGNMGHIKVGDTATCTISGVSGVVVKQYVPTASEQQTMVRCADGRLYHAPTRTWRKEVNR